jgi:hypothetical protein
MLLLAGGFAQEHPRDSRFRKPLKMGQMDNTTFVGIVTDTSCGAKHKMADKSAGECARACHRAGAAYALVAGDNLYILQGREDEVGRVAGQRAKITGTLSGRRIAVYGVAATQ